MHGKKVIATFKGNEIRSSVILNDNVLIQIPLNRGFTLSIDNNVIFEGNSTPNKKSDVLTLTKHLLGELVFNKEYEKGKISMLELLDLRAEISYFEKLKFIQSHLLKGKTLSSKYVKTIDDAQASIISISELQPNSEGQYDFEISDWQDTLVGGVEDEPIDIDGFDPRDPSRVDCRSTLVLNHTDQISLMNTQNLNTLPFKHKYYSGTPYFTNGNITNNYEWKHGQLFLGASVSRDLMNHGWITTFGGSPNWKKEEFNDLTSNSNANHYQNLLYKLAVSSGYYSSAECACSKEFTLRGVYRSHIDLRNSILGTANNTAARAQAVDFAISSVTDINALTITPIQAGVLEVSGSCNTTTNPKWTAQWDTLAKGIVNATAAGIKAYLGATTGQIGAVIGALQNNGLGSIASSIAHLTSTKRRILTGQCGHSTTDSTIIDYVLPFTIQPNQSLMFTLSSGQYGMVEGDRHWQSEVEKGAQVIWQQYLIQVV